MSWSRHWRKRLLDPLAWQLSRRELRRFFDREDAKSIFEATRQYVGRGFYASLTAVQEPEEIVALARRVIRLAPKVVVEIGTFKGGTLFIWCRASPSIRKAVSIDLPGGLYGGGYDWRRAKLYREFLADREEAELVCLRADSQSASTCQELEDSLAGAPVDFLYIDGDHRYEGVKADFQNYSGLVRPGGMIAFHDIVTRTADSDVAGFWREIKENHDHEELIAGPRSNKGIGVLYV